MASNIDVNDYTESIRIIADAYLLGDERCRREAIKTLLEMGTPEARRLLHSLALTEDDQKFRYYCRKALTYLHGNVSQKTGIFDLLSVDSKALREQASEEDPWVRLQAVTDLSVYFSEPDLAVFFAGKLRQEKHPYVKSALVKALARHGDKSHIEILSYYLHDKDTRVQANTVEALEMLGDESVYPLLIPMLQDVDNRVRANVAKALAAHNPAEVLESIAEMMVSENVWERDSAAYALGELNINGSVDLLTRALSDESVNVRATAQESLKKLASSENSRARKALMESNPVSLNPEEMLDMMEAL